MRQKSPATRRASCLCELVIVLVQGAEGVEASRSHPSLLRYASRFEYTTLAPSLQIVAM
jgi:hypothetical protein